MAKFKVLRKFRDKHTKEIYEPGAIIDMTVKRSKEVEKNIGKSYIERWQEAGEQ